MEVFRITTKKWANSLSGSGYQARWNSNGKFVIYTSSTRALASLENIVHRSGEGLNEIFKVMVINIPSSLNIKTVTNQQLVKEWFEFKNYPRCQKIGDKWLNDNKFPILKVPSSIIRKEFNYLINPNHKDFKKIKITRTENFKFDPRLSKD